MTPDRPVHQPEPKGLVERYEQLRGLALERGGSASQGLGFTLIVDKGVTAWTTAWSDCEPLHRTEKRPLSRPPPAPPTARAEVIQILTQMVLIPYEEANQ